MARTGQASFPKLQTVTLTANGEDEACLLRKLETTALSHMNSCFVRPWNG